MSKYAYAYSIEPGQIDGLLKCRVSQGILASRDFPPGRNHIVQRFVDICLEAIERIVAVHPENIRRKIGFCFSIDHRRNAFAYNPPSPGLPVIVIHSVMIPLIYIFYTRLFKEGGIYINTDVLKKQKLSQLLTQSIDQLWSEVNPLPPTGNNKQTLLWDMIESTLSFIVFHELAHLLRDHSGRLSNKDSHAMSEDTRQRAPTKEDAQKNQIAEFDADRLAAEWLVALWLDRWQSAQFCRDDIEKSRFALYRDEAQFAILILINIFVAFRIFYDVSRDIDDIELGYHPPASARNLLAITTLYTMLRKRSRKKIIKAVDKNLNWDKLEGIYCAVMEEKFDIEGREFTLSGSMHQYSLDLIQSYIGFAESFVDLGDGHKP